MIALKKMLNNFMSKDACGLNKITSVIFNILIINSSKAVADLKGGREGRAALPPRGPKFFQFHAVFGKIWQNHMLAPPPRGSWRPLLGKILDPPLKSVV